MSNGPKPTSPDGIFWERAWRSCDRDRKNLERELAEAKRIAEAGRVQQHIIDGAIHMSGRIDDYVALKQTLLGSGDYMEIASLLRVLARAAIALGPRALINTARAENEQGTPGTLPPG